MKQSTDKKSATVTTTPGTGAGAVTTVSPTVYPFQPQPNTHVSTAGTYGAPIAEPRNFFGNK